MCLSDLIRFYQTGTKPKESALPTPYYAEPVRLLDEELLTLPIFHESSSVYYHVIIIDMCVRPTDKSTLGII